MSIEDKINKIAAEEFEKTDEPYDYRYGLRDDKFNMSSFCCEIERLYGYKAEDVHKVLKGAILDSPLEFLSNNRSYQLGYIIDIQNAIIKLDEFIEIKKKYMKKNLG